MKKKWLVAVLFVAGLLGLLPSALAAALPGEARADASTGSKGAINWRMASISSMMIRIIRVRRSFYSA